MARYVLGENAARQFRALVRGKGEVGNRPAQGAAVAFDAEYANPFTVQWAASVDGGSWIIWLPSSDLVIFDAEAIDPTKDLQAAGGDYPTGWYKLDGSTLSNEAGGELWLNISWGDEKSARFAGSKESDAEKSLAVPICKATVNSETGARWVRQIVTSAIVTGSGSDVEIKGGTGITVTEDKIDEKVTATVSNTGVIGLLGQNDSKSANGTITAKGAYGSGLKVTVTRTAEPTEQAPRSDGTLEVDIDGRSQSDAFGPKELQLEGKKVAMIFGTANVNIKQKKIAAGTGVTVTEANGVVTVSATGAATSGFTGSRTVLADTQYSGHYLQKRFYTETWKDGVLVSSTLGNWITYHTAVEETA